MVLKSFITGKLYIKKVISQHIFRLNGSLLVTVMAFHLKLYKGKGRYNPSVRDPSYFLKVDPGRKASNVFEGLKTFQSRVTETSLLC